MKRRPRVAHGEIDPADVLGLASKPANELTFGERLNLLWLAVRPLPGEDPQAWRKAEAVQQQSGSAAPAQRPQYTNTYVAQQLDERYGVRITPSYLGKLRHDDKINPSLPVLQALASFFNIDTAFLLPATTRADREKIGGVRDDLLAWITRAADTVVEAAKRAGGNTDGIAIELRLPGATTSAEAERQVALALAQWLEAQATDHADQRGQAQDQ
jgi:transcriptional regulator with XRE-family HTH domain